MECIGITHCNPFRKRMFIGSPKQPIKMISKEIVYFTFSPQTEEEIQYQLNILHSLLRKKHEYNFTPQHIKHYKTFGNFSSWLGNLCLSRDENYLIASTGDKTIKIWDLTGKHAHTLRGHNDDILNIYVSHRQNWIISTSSDKHVNIYNLESGDFVMNIPLTFICWSVCTTRDDRFILLGSKRNVEIFDTQNRKFLHPLKGHSMCVLSICVDHQNEFIISSSLDGLIKIWSLETFRCVNTLVGHQGWTVVSLSPNNKYIVSASRDTTIKIWDWKRGHLLTSFKAHDYAIDYVRFIGDEYIMSCDVDKNLKIWNVYSEKCVVYMKNVLRVCYGENRKWIITYTSDRLIKIFK